MGVARDQIARRAARPFVPDAYLMLAGYTFHQAQTQKALAGFVTLAQIANWRPHRAFEPVGAGSQQPD
jgi:hypothetical protein